jgi:hypothetical protein
VAVLTMGSALPHLLKSELLQQGSHLAGFQDRQRRHAYATRIVWRPMNSVSSWGSPSSRSISITS